MNDGKGIKKLDFAKSRVVYTITEGIKIFEVAQAKNRENTGAKFWKDKEAQGIIPFRSSESMRNFFKTHNN